MEMPRVIDQRAAAAADGEPNAMNLQLDGKTAFVSGSTAAIPT
jgi:hypothetical protein